MVSRELSGVGEYENERTLEVTKHARDIIIEEGLYALTGSIKRILIFLIIFLNFQFQFPNSLTHSHRLT